MACEIVAGQPEYETTEATPAPMLDRDRILSAARNFKRELIDVPEFGGRVWVREFTASECDVFSDLSTRIDAERNPEKREQMARLRTAKVVVWCACNEDGTRLFVDNDIEALGQAPYVAVNRIANAAVRLSGFGEAIVQTLAEAQGN